MDAHGLALSALLQTAVVWFVPLGTFFRVVPLSGEQWLFSTAAAFAIVPISEAIKAFLRLRKKCKAGLHTKKETSMIDYHIHTAFSADCDVPLRAYGAGSV